MNLSTRTGLNTAFIDANLLHRNDNGNFCAEASDLGFAPGWWPHYIFLNGESFFFQDVREKIRRDGTRVYHSHPPGKQLTIFND